VLDYDCDVVDPAKAANGFGNAVGSGRWGHGAEGSASDSGRGLRP
jgi:hypothetical protein